MIKKRLLQKLLPLCLLFISSSSIASQGAGLFFNLSVSGADVEANTTIPHHFYPNAGIKVNTPGYDIQLVNVTNARIRGNSNPSCTLSPDGFCLFSVSDTQSQIIRLAGDGGMVSLTMCLNARNPISCQYYTVDVSSLGFKSQAVIQNAGSHTISICKLGQDGGLSQCHLSENASISDAENHSNKNAISNARGDTLYVTQTQQNQISVCELNHGVVGICHTNSGDGTLNAPVGVLALDEKRNLAYIANSGNSTISICHILTGGDLGGCVSVSNTTLNMPNDIRIS